MSFDKKKYIVKGEAAESDDDDEVADEIGQVRFILIGICWQIDAKFTI